MEKGQEFRIKGVSVTVVWVGGFQVGLYIRSPEKRQRISRAFRGLSLSLSLFPSDTRGLSLSGSPCLLSRLALYLLYHSVVLTAKPEERENRKDRRPRSSGLAAPAGNPSKCNPIPSRHSSSSSVRAGVHACCELHGVVSCRCPAASSGRPGAYRTAARANHELRAGGGQRDR
ncbi:hypothetical protein LX36DRAFT_112301 [Colletotrichum falcatum]|nr:hypothetical protein LX36DRAFT_112301 [Colletotrichum falcatum]